MANERILIVDDDPEIRDMLEEHLRNEGCYPLTAGCAKAAMSALRSQALDVVLLDVRLPDADGMELLKTALIPELGYHKVIMLSAYGTHKEVEEAILAGAYDYLAKPLSLPRVRIAVRNCLHLQELEKKLADVSGEGVPTASLRDLIGASPEILALTDQIRQVAPYDVPVLILGENGTGKDLVAQALHALSPRRTRPFVPMDCGALPETLVEAEIFGYERGAFSGAVQARAGKLERADGGVLFLDEIGNIPAVIQPKLLRVLQSFLIERLGGQEQKQVDVRVLSATNADLDGLVSNGRFRMDLYHRLSTTVLRVPPLRERKGDVALLAHYFLMKISRAYKKDVHTISPRTMAVLEAYAWPGNVRELENCLQSAVIMADRVVEPCHLPQRIREWKAGPATGVEGAARKPGETLTEIGRRAAEAAQRAAILQTLDETGWNKAEAAKRLRVDYKTLHVKMHLYGLQRPEQRSKQKPLEEPGGGR